MIKRYHFLHSSDDPIADEANIGVADKVGGSFVVNSAFASLFSEVNTDALEYAPSISSDQLELFFTRAYKKIDGSFEFNIYMASRNNTSEP
ncbi:MAG TPA: hypothetical protein DCZ03_04345 [Gammaproteobacteria bacterium]|nr:hypothetical protein [Gammaproteobacteria bacterium]